MSGWKAWQIGEVVDADDFQTYVQDQVVQVYADSAARSAALGTAVAQGMVSYLEDTSALQVYGTAWANVSNPGDITGVTAGTGLSGGGDSGAVTLNVNIAAVGSAISITASQISDVTATAAELNILDGVTSTAAELNILDGATLSTAELNLLDGVTATTAELNYLDGVTSNVQTQLDNRVNRTNGTVGTATPGSAVVRNITLSTAVPSGGADGDVWLQYTP
jgi:hypothetical protein